MEDIEDLIRCVNADDEGARDRLFAAAYDGLKKLARARLRIDGGRHYDLQTTALVNESYLRFINGGRLRSEHRNAFFRYASAVMRTVIIDAVRERKAQRRGGDLQHVTLDTGIGDNVPAEEDEILDFDGALARLEAVEPRLAKVVEMRYFGGYTELEVAAASVAIRKRRCAC
jgi:RNA polymerase sigma factor (TIGR02999 family)